MAVNVFLRTVVPILGGLVAIVMYCSPLRAAYTVRQQQSLGDLNPIPFAVTFVSTSCWNAYGFAAPDWNMFLPNIPGLAAALFTCLATFGHASRKVQNIMLVILCGWVPVLLLLLGVMTRFVCSAQQGRLLWGFTSNIVTICYYGAPLSSAVQVVRQRSSASIYLPTCITNLVNAALWVAYGIAVADAFIWVPNSVGGVFAALLIGLCCIFPKPTAITAGITGANSLSRETCESADGGAAGSKAGLLAAAVDAKCRLARHDETTEPTAAAACSITIKSFDPSRPPPPPPAKEGNRPAAKAAQCATVDLVL